ncbi:MAG: RNA pseudouridine synthase [Treponema sp.]|jgi:23S rRNA pseudouridine1911/1915/1917 synthase|nr:RNA pseudouridine synthase [Treponema sp.]
MSGGFSLWTAPRVIDETGACAVLYKPPLMFAAPLSDDPSGTLLGWFAGLCPAVLEAGGERNREGGLLHRLDFETEGLVLCAKTQEAFVSLRAQQSAGDFVKEYDAAVIAADGGGSPELPGFPALPPSLAGTGLSAAGPPVSIESFFRPWGPGRKAVRPVVRGPARGGPYRTEILAVSGGPAAREAGSPRILTVRISRGFRHQIRCHLAWIGEPILNDVLYGGTPVRQRDGHEEPGEPASRKPASRDGTAKRPIALRARGFRFFDPSTGIQRDYRLPGFAETPGLAALCN